MHSSSGRATKPIRATTSKPLPDRPHAKILKAKTPRCAALDIEPLSVSGGRLSHAVDIAQEARFDHVPYRWEQPMFQLPTLRFCGEQSRVADAVQRPLTVHRKAGTVTSAAFRYDPALQRTASRCAASGARDAPHCAPILRGTTFAVAG
jgi:hypothetical protein